jgi:hypothetical protein
MCSTATAPLIDHAVTVVVDSVAEFRGTGVDAGVVVVAIINSRKTVPVEVFRERFARPRRGSGEGGGQSDHEQKSQNLFHFLNPP